LLEKRKVDWGVSRDELWKLSNKAESPVAEAESSKNNLAEFVADTIHPKSFSHKSGRWTSRRQKKEFAFRARGLPLYVGSDDWQAVGGCGAGILRRNGG